MSRPGAQTEGAAVFTHPVQNSDRRGLPSVGRHSAGEQDSSPEKAEVLVPNTNKSDGCCGLFLKQVMFL